MTVNELIKKTPLDSIANLTVPVGNVVSLSDSASYIKQIAETNQQVTKLLNTMSTISVKDILTTIGTQGNASNILALSSLRQLGELDNVTDIVNALSIVDNDNNKLIPYGRKTSKGIKALGSVLDSVIDIVPLSAGVKLALKGSTGFLVSALVEFAPEIGDLIFEGFRAVEYELIELIIDKLFRDNDVTSIDSGKQCEDVLLALKKAFLDADDKPLLNRITQALRAGLLDFERQTDWMSGEKDNPESLVDGLPVTLDNKPLIDKLLKGLSYQQRDSSGDAIIRDGTQGFYQPDATLALWELYNILRTGLTQDVYDADGLPVYDSSGNIDREGVLLPLLTKALLKQDTDADGNPITNAGGQPVYISRFDFGSSDVAEVLRECFKRPKLDDNGQIMTDEDGLPLYADAFLSDIVDQLNQTTEVWTLDGVRLFIRDRLIEYT